MGLSYGKIFIFTVFSLMIVVCTSNTVFAATLEVGPGHQYSDINSAIDDSSPYDEILVYPNNGYAYIENVVIDQNNLNVRAETTNGKVTISADDDTLPTVTIDSTGNHSTLQGFIITGSDASTDESMGVKIDDNAGYCTVTNNNITGNNRGIVLHASNCNITGNTIYGNYEEGINVQSDPSSNVISSNTIESNQNGGIVLDHTVSGCVIAGNIIQNNLYCGIAVFSSSNYINITENDIEGNPIGINYFSAGSGNTITSNNITANGLDGIYLNENTAIILFNRIYNNGQYDLNSAASGQINAENSWWGTNSPTSTQIHGSVDYDPWIILKATVTTTHVPHGGTSTITADLTYNSDNIQPLGGYIPNGVLTTFQVVSGSDYGSVFPLINYTNNGNTVSIFTGTSNTGNATINITVDGQKVNISILVGEASITIIKTVEDGYTHEMKTVFDQGDKPLYRIKITNNGPDSATGLGVMDLLPDGLTYLMRWVSTNNGTTWTWNSTAYDFVTGNWSIGTLAPGASATILAILTNITVSDTTITNIATLYLNEYNANTDSVNVTITVNPILSEPLTALSSPDPPTSITQTPVIITSSISKEVNKRSLEIIISATNIFNSPLKVLLIQILQSTGFSYIFHIESIGSFFDPVTGIWTIESINPQETVQLIINALVEWDATSKLLSIITEILKWEFI